MESLQTFIENRAFEWIFDAGIACIILFAFWLFFRLTKPALTRLLFQNGFDNYLVDIAINSFYKSIIVIIAIITALAQIGINVLAAMTGFGIAGIAIGFAAKDTLGNIISGITILWDKPFIVGDWIEIDGQYGQVQFITLRTTRIHTLDNHHVIIPNQAVINSTVENHHHARPVRRKATVHLPYGSDIDKAKEVILHALEHTEEVLKKPEPGIGVGETNNGLVPLFVFTWSPNARKAVALNSAVYAASARALVQNGFSVPHPVVLAESPRVSKKIRKTTKTRQDNKN